MLIKRPADIPSSAITPKSVYMPRREFLGALVAVTGLGDQLTARMPDRHDQPPHE